jgi:hypothetical protein
MKRASRSPHLYMENILIQRLFKRSVFKKYISANHTTVWTYFKHRMAVIAQRFVAEPYYDTVAKYLSVSFRTVDWFVNLYFAFLSRFVRLVKCTP